MPRGLGSTAVAGLFRALAEHTGDFVGVMNDAGEALLMNRSVRGASADSVLGRALEDFLSADRAKELRELLDEARRQGVANGSETQVVALDGSLRLFNERCVKVSPPGEAPIYLLIRTETTRLRETEAELKASELRYRALFEANPDPVLVACAAEGRVLSANAAATALFGDGVSGQLLEQLFSAQDRHLALSAAAGERRYSARLIAPPAREFSAELVERVIDLDGGRARIVVVRDMSERERLEEQLRVVEKLESMALFAGGVAHDFNNLLTIIASCAEEAARNSSARGVIAAKHILDAAARGTRLNRKLMMFSRRDMQTMEQADAGEIVREMLPILTRAARSLRLVTELDPRPCELLCDRVQLEQVLLNLVVNAEQAFPHDGAEVDARVELRVRPVVVDAAYQSEHPFALRRGAFVELQVSDRGAGMPKELLARVFDPFFTTKATGTGLGLSVVHGVVEQHGGFIGVRSEVGRGTTFTLLLPARVTESDAPSSRPSRKRLLVVDDEPALLRLTSSNLAEQGYDIVTAADADEALALFEVDRDAFDLVLMDLILPRRSGREVLQDMRRLRPDLRALLMTGDPDGPELVAGLAVGLLRKPYSSRELCETVRRALDS